MEDLKTLSGNLKAQIEFLRACAKLHNFEINSVKQQFDEGDELDDEE